MRQRLDHLCAPETLRSIQATEPCLLLDMPKGLGLGLQGSDRVTGYKLPLKACSRIASAVMNCIPRRAMHQRQRCHKSGLKLLPCCQMRPNPRQTLCCAQPMGSQTTPATEAATGTRDQNVVYYGICYGILWYVMAHSSRLYRIL